ncbi:LysR family transcriptional regulator substrate-binding protein [Paenibacillus sp. 32352]|uniref:LysR family transcriptional regulator substrate-binding protein n=1 Tax=Paenibacillus sp. 32352 TaxID=1969111 RepID=UPI002119298A|nr:LysR family transcriptional regulator substrate-binding protein [Paenibacillus sp. 32352]
MGCRRLAYYHRYSTAQRARDRFDLPRRLLPEFHEAYPEVQVRIISADNVSERLHNNEIDLALTITPVHDKRIISQLLYKENGSQFVSILYIELQIRHPWQDK